MHYLYTLMIWLHSSFLLQHNLCYNSPTVCRCSQSTGRSSCSIVSGDISNCSYRLSFLSVAHSHLSFALKLFIDENQKNGCSVDRHRQVETRQPERRLDSWLPATRRNGDNLNRDNCGHNGDRLSKNGKNATSQNDDDWNNLGIIT